MAQYIDLRSEDQHLFRAFVVEPPVPARAAVVILQEMDQRGWGSDSARPSPASNKSALPGVNAYARAVAKSYAAEGYLAIAPSTFSRGRSGHDYGYLYDDSHRKGHPRIVKPLQALPSPLVMLDIRAAIEHGRQLAPGGQVAVLGFCWGGLLAWRAACSLEGLQAAVCYYGGGMTEAPESAQKPRCPVLAHMPQDKHWMSQSSIQDFGAAHTATAFLQPGDAPQPWAGEPLVQIEKYEADYGFDNPQRPGAHSASALLARQRTLHFLARQLTVS
jgi:carboxymethylenebutenolidase